MELLLVGIGGAFGSLARYTLGKLISEKVNTTFPIATFLINISGAFLLGVINGIVPERSISVLLADGFLGAYTTFSTFMYEGFNLFQENEKINAFRYILGTLFTGVVGFVLGLIIGKALKYI